MATGVVLLSMRYCSSADVDVEWLLVMLSMCCCWCCRCAAGRVVEAHLFTVVDLPVLLVTPVQEPRGPEDPHMRAHGRKHCDSLEDTTRSFQESSKSL